MGGVSSGVSIQAIRRVRRADRACGEQEPTGQHVHISESSAGDTRVQRCVWLLTASGVSEHPAAVGAVVEAAVPLAGLAMAILAQVVDGELVRLWFEIGVEEWSLLQQGVRVREGQDQQ